MQIETHLSVVEVVVDQIQLPSYIDQYLEVCDARRMLTCPRSRRAIASYDPLRSLLMVWIQGCVYRLSEKSLNTRLTYDLCNPRSRHFVTASLTKDRPADIP